MLRKVAIILATEVEYSTQEESNLSGIIEIAEDCSDTDLSSHHDNYLYGEVWY